MALKDFRTKVSKNPTEEKAVPKATTSNTYIDRGCHLSGKLRFSETVQIDGRIEGEIEGQETVIIGESGSIHASVTCESIVIFGEVEGDVEAKRMITLHKSARVIAQMQTAGIVIEEGAKFKGQILIGSDEGQIGPTKPSSSPQPVPKLPPQGVGSEKP
jgi:cytoskeletal protein CcmA (bactofilin family)